MGQEKRGALDSHGPFFLIEAIVREHSCAASGVFHESLRLIRWSAGPGG
jgi:hypothetical protein